MLMRIISAVILAFLAGFLPPAKARSEVRFGNNVFIGGHDVSNQTFNSERRGAYYLYEGRPAHPGCAWRDNGGSRTKVCHLQRKQR